MSRCDADERGMMGEHVQCGACGTRYHVDVLTLPTSAQGADAG
jgi:hypothetical protein